MEEDLLDIYDKVKTCSYRGETYHVRNNGAIFRHQRDEGRKRPLDEVWMFGKPNNHAYMLISSTPVHRIVATAFHGPAPTESHIVDHIDTNRQNNRPENLRWITKIENLLLNPITARRIEIAYGSIENFLENPNQPLDGKLDKNFDWMRTVSKEEAQQSRKRLQKWAESGSIPSGGPLGEWLYEPRYVEPVEESEPDDGLSESLTLNAIQKDWKTPSEFPCCPSEIGETPLEDYHKCLKEGAVFAKSWYGESFVVSAVLTENGSKLLVLCNIPDGVKKWSVAKVTVDEQHFIHESLRTFFELDGAKKRFTLEQGLEWEGGDTIDDFS